MATSVADAADRAAENTDVKVSADTIDVSAALPSAGCSSSESVRLPNTERTDDRNVPVSGTGSGATAGIVLTEIVVDAPPANDSTKVDAAATLGGASDTEEGADSTSETSDT